MTRNTLAVALSLVACTRVSAESADPVGSAPSEDGATSVTAMQAVATSVFDAVKPAAGSRRARLEAARTTQEVLGALSPDCLPCAVKNGCLDPTQAAGGVCETAAGKAKFSEESEAELCVKALQCVFRTKCANTGEESQCLCGKTDVMDCMAGKAPPTGTCVDVYKIDFGGDGKTMYTEFVNPKLGVGRANQLLQCVIPSCPTCRIP